MNKSIKNLQKFFRQESKTGYQDKAVVGGLASMVNDWVQLAQQDDIPDVIIKVVSSRLRDYNRLNSDAREVVLKGLWNRIKKDLADQFPDEPNQTKKTKKESKKNIEKKTQKQSNVEDVFEAFSKKVEEKKKNHVEKVVKITKNTFHRELKKENIDLNQNVTSINGIGPKNAEKLSRLGITTLKDLLYHFPRRYDDYSKYETINRLQDEDIVSVMGVVKSIHGYNGRSGNKIIEAVIKDGTGSISATWFNQPWIRNTIKIDDQITISGKVDLYLGKKTINNPEYEKIDEDNLNTGRILPVYPLTARLSQQWMRKQIYGVLNDFSPNIQETLTEEIIDEAELIYLSDAVYQTHFPEIEEIIQIAKYRIAFDELFFLQLSMQLHKNEWNKKLGKPLQIQDDYIDQFSSVLPFTLTNAQKKAMEVIEEDLSSEIPMNRLIQGDVGSGKTIVAGFAISTTIQNNAQIALMAPTSILADQHYAGMFNLLVNQLELLQPNEVVLLVGATPQSEKEEIYQKLESGEIKLIIGTHALIQDKVNFKNLQLVIIDEQHRFGVNQRAELRNKGENINMLVMTATPIPRSLSLTLFGDLNVTLIDEMPAGRMPIETYVVTPKERERIYTFIEKEVENGNQAFIVVPLVDESETIDQKSAIQEYENLSTKVFYKQNVGLIHGKMTQIEKDDVMLNFKNGNLDILISTTVIEVGVDIPNATIMMIEGAERFGLAQLHQLRGRVGRGQNKSYCILVASSKDDKNNQRLKVMEEITDGFELAEKDLEQRGAGDFYGVRQSGFSELQIMSLLNMPLIEQTQSIAQKLLKSDPNLEKEINLPIKEALDKYKNFNLGERS